MENYQDTNRFQPELSGYSASSRTEYLDSRVEHKKISKRIFDHSENLTLRLEDDFINNFGNLNQINIQLNILKDTFNLLNAALRVNNNIETATFNLYILEMMEASNLDFLQFNQRLNKLTVSINDSDFNSDIILDLCSSLAYNQNLKFLKLCAQCKVSGDKVDIFNNLFQASRLESFILEKMDLSELSPESTFGIDHNKFLRELKFTDCTLTNVDSVFEALMYNQCLITLELTRCCEKISYEKLTTSLQFNYTLISLTTICQGQMNHDFIQVLAKHPALQSLYLHSNCVSMELGKSIKKMLYQNSRIKVFSLNISNIIDFPITLEILKSLKKNNTLEELCVPINRSLEPSNAIVTECKQIFFENGSVVGLYIDDEDIFDALSPYAVRNRTYCSVPKFQELEIINNYQLSEVNENVHALIYNLKRNPSECYKASGITIKLIDQFIGPCDFSKNDHFFISKSMAIFWKIRKDLFSEIIAYAMRKSYDAFLCAITNIFDKVKTYMHEPRCLFESAIRHRNYDVAVYILKECTDLEIQIFDVKEAIKTNHIEFAKMIIQRWKFTGKYGDIYWTSDLYDNIASGCEEIIIALLERKIPLFNTSKDKIIPKLLTMPDNRGIDIIAKYDL